MKETPRHYCRGCSTAESHVISLFSRGGVSTNAAGRRITIWVCTKCSTRRTEMENVPDVEGMCINVERDWRRSKDENSTVVVRLEREDLLQHLAMTALLALASWDPSKCESFRAYLSTKLPNGLIDLIRNQIGRTQPKLHATADSLDALLDGGGDGEPSRGDGSELGGPLGSVDLDGREDRHADDALRALSARRGAIAREDRRLGIRPPSALAV